jgi:hypothetical protein
LAVVQLAREGVGVNLDLSHEPDLGFIFYPAETVDHPGHSRLDFILREQPSSHRYDLESVNFVVASAAGAVEGLTVHHPWQGDKQYRACASRIILSDRQGKRVEAFSFGGDLQIVSGRERVVCALVSPAPIYALYAFDDLSTWLVEKAEFLLAEKRAQWCPEHSRDFEDRVVVAEPNLLYTCCRVVLQERFRGRHLSADARLARGQRFVMREIWRLQDQRDWPPNVPILDQFS